MSVRSMLGIDIGTTNIRIALARSDGNDCIAELFASRESPSGSVIAGTIAEPDLIAAQLEEMLQEHGIREKRCVCALGAPVASLRTMHFPAMTAFERMRAACLEIERERGSIEKTTVRVHPHSETHLLGTALSRAATSRVAALRKAGLRPVAIDFEGTALCDAFPGTDAVIDIGSERTSLHAVTSKGDVLTAWAAIGGDSITEAIAHDLALDRTIAESRKRLLGTAGAGETAILELVEAIADAVESFRRRRHSIDSAACVGNTARLQGLCERIEQRCALKIAPQLPYGLSPVHFSEDLGRAVRMDCALAVSLARWQVR